jgi:hypothetical protein
MRQDDYSEFCEIWTLSQELGVNGKVYSSAAMTEMFETLEAYRIEDVSAALRKHRNDNKFAPVLHDVLDVLNPKLSSRHLMADEAWAIALKSMDESETVVLTDEIMQSRSIAWDVWETGDKVAARMAFKSAYERIVTDASSPTWRISLGHDQQRRVEAISLAVEKGLLPKSELAKLGTDHPKGKQLSVERLALTASEKAATITPDENDKILAELEAMRKQVAGQNAEKDRKTAERIEQLRKRKEAAEAVCKILERVT